MSRVRIKICGITRVEDALTAVELGADLIGMNFYAGSPRCVSIERARKIANSVKERAKVVGVFVNAGSAEVLRIAREVPLDMVQLHGDEAPAECAEIAREFAVIRALRVDGSIAVRAREFAAYPLLLDTPCEAYGGSGEVFDWEQVRGLSAGHEIYLAGGLTAANVAEGIQKVRPTVVDVCSGVEAEKGVKSLQKMREFVAAVRVVEGRER